MFVWLSVLLLLSTSSSFTSAISIPIPRPCLCPLLATDIILCRICDPGKGPPCTRSECIDGKCVFIAPCSQNVSQPCTSADQCPVSKVCLDCVKGRWPFCPIPTCINGQCGEIAPCFLPIRILPSCTPTDLSQCNTDTYCKSCPAGYWPPCR